MKETQIKNDVFTWLLQFMNTNLLLLLLLYMPGLADKFIGGRNFLSANWVLLPLALTLIFAYIESSVDGFFSIKNGGLFVGLVHYVFAIGLFWMFLVLYSNPNEIAIPFWTFASFSSLVFFLE